MEEHYAFRVTRKQTRSHIKQENYMNTKNNGVERAVSIAIENGWEDDGVAYGMQEGVTPDNGDPKVDGWFYSKEICLDHLFWTSLGKGLGWSWVDDQGSRFVDCDEIQGGYRFHKKTKNGYYTDYNWTQERQDEVMWHWHRLIDHLWEKKDIESFFTNLLANH